MLFNNLYPSRFLKAADLAEGQSATGVIEGLDMESFDDGDKPVITFRDNVKRLILNKTNATFIKDALGSGNTDDWVGAKLTLISQVIVFKGKVLPSLRVTKAEVKHVKPEQVARAVPRADDGWADFSV